MRGYDIPTTLASCFLLIHCKSHGLIKLYKIDVVVYTS